MEVWKTIFLSKLVIGRFHVNLPGCIFEKANLFPINHYSGKFICQISLGCTGVRDKIAGQSNNIFSMP